MSLLATIADGLLSGFRAEGDPTDERYWSADTPSVLSSTGIRVTPSLAFQTSCVVQGTRLISETVGRVPLKVFRERADGGKDQARDHFLWPILRKRPNPWQSGIEWRQVMTAIAVLWGASYSEKKFQNHTMELWPLDPDKIQVDQLATGRLRIHVTREDGRIDTLTQDQVFRLNGFGIHRFMGANLLSLAREAIGLWLAMEKFGGLFFWQGMKPSLGIEVPGALDDEAYDRLQKSVERRGAGLPNMHRVLLVENAGKIHEFGFSPEESQMTQSRQEQVREFARWFNIPVHMFHAGGAPPKASAEQLAREMVDYTLMPWWVRWEAAIDRDLIVEDDILAEHTTEALLRGNFKEQVEAFSLGIMNGFMSENEVRALLNMNPVPGLDEPRRSVNQDRGEEPRQEEEEEGGEDGDGEDDGEKARLPSRRLRLIARAAAGRIVRRELSTLTREAARLAGDKEEWGAWLGEFYGSLVPALVSQILELEPTVAHAYCERHYAALLGEGLSVAEGWEDSAVEELTRLALEEERIDA